MFLSKKNDLTNNVRHRRELLWDPFLNKNIQKKQNKVQFFKFLEHKLPAYCIKGYYLNKFNRKIYTILTDYSDNTILTPIKYGFEMGHCSISNYYSFISFEKLNSANINKTFLIFCDNGTLVYFINNDSNNIKMATTYGVFAVVYKHVQNTHLTKIKLPSGQIKYLPSSSEAYLGRNGNMYFKHVVWGSWGFKHKNKFHRPVVRGVAMNPVDHPNGGRSKVKKPFRNKYNKIAKAGK